MRPSELDPFFAPLAKLPGLGPKLAPLYDRLLKREDGGARALDLLLHLPVDRLNRVLSPSLAQAPVEGLITVQVTVEAHRPPPPGRAKAPHRVLVGDDSGDMTLVFFKMPRAQLETMLPVGATKIISGRVELFDGLRQMVHPERILLLEQYDPENAAEAVYALTEGLSHRRIAKAVETLLARLPDLPEWGDAALIAREAWPSFTAALASLHNPNTRTPRPAERRLAYDELLAGQLALRLVRAAERIPRGKIRRSAGTLEQTLRGALPFRLTHAQNRVIDEIKADLASPERMVRLVQGDVGAGKTLVALAAMLQVVEAGEQAAMMAPTEILARQHYERIAPLCAPLGVRTALLTGRAGAAERRAVLGKLAAGEIDLLLGTHALFQEEVVFKALGLAVVDEQHRFGVAQRLALAQKGEAVDLLVMSATPIPRTLLLTAFGDLDVSQLDEKPPGRLPVDTRLISHDRLEDVMAGLGRAIGQGAQVYWVCPLVSESEMLDLVAAEERFKRLEALYPGRVGLVHGKMPGAEKDRIIADFASGACDILVATTVIEVGMDVPQASVMVIEEAQRFGLAQLHQLRGRVGRGQAKASALLVYRGPLGQNSRARLEILRQTEDGFRIAEEDLRLRGEGDVLGTRQSGMPGFRVANLEKHMDLLFMARQEADLILARDAALTSERGRTLRMLLYLFERDVAIKLMEAG